MKCSRENIAVSKELIEVTLQPRLKDGKRVSPEHAWENVTGSGHSQCKGPEVGASTPETENGVD